MKNLVHKTIYTKYIRREYVNIDELVIYARRKIEEMLSYAWFYCEDVSFIQLITPEVCIDFLNGRKDKYKDTFENIPFETSIGNYTIFDIIYTSINTAYNILAEIENIPNGRNDYGYVLEEDDES